MPKISIVVPIHDMKGGPEFLWRNINSILMQTFKDYEIIITKEGKMAENTNAGMLRARGDIVKILYLDDYLAHENSLQEIVDHFKEKDQWMITGCDTNPQPYWTDNIHIGNNKLGSPSVLAIRRTSMLFFDERMSWLLDCDLYKRLYDKYGPPKIIWDKNVIIGVGDHQMTHILTDEEKQSEHQLISKKYE